MIGRKFFCVYLPHMTTNSTQQEGKEPFRERKI